MRLTFPAAAIFLLGFSTGLVFAQGILPGDRWSVREIPRICRREIPQFILRENTSTRRPNENPSKLYAIPKGLFIPVSQDKNGVFYHAMNGLVENRGADGVMFVSGGLYVNKSKPNVIDVYFGDARKTGSVLSPYVELRSDVLAKLQISHFASGKTRKQIPH
jgi:hypothetical protein